MPRRAVIALVGLALALLQAPLHAQTNDSLTRRASFMAGASLGDGETALALSAGLEWKLSPRVGIDFELAYARKLDFALDLCPAPLVCVRGGRLPVTGRTVSLVPHLAIDLRPDARIRPYVQAGVGIGHLRQRYFDPPLGSVGATPLEYTRSRLALALSAGGGVAVTLSRRLAVGADVRALTIADENTPVDRFITPYGALHTVRIGSRVSWAF
jgi:opacity protein-like surface antigen